MNIVKTNTYFRNEPEYRVLLSESELEALIRAINGYVLLVGPREIADRFLIESHRVIHEHE